MGNKVPIPVYRYRLDPSLDGRDILSDENKKSEMELIYSSPYVDISSDP